MRFNWLRHCVCVSKGLGGCLGVWLKAAAHEKSPQVRGRQDGAGLAEWPPATAGKLCVETFSEYQYMIMCIVYN